MEYREFGKYTLLNLMGKGGVGSVYRANDNEAGIVLAIKIYEPSARRSLKIVRGLRDREVRMLISIQHPNVVKYYESGEIENACYYTMEFVEDSLHNHMHNANELTLPDKIHILRQICNALQAIHHQGIVHRDIKPPNILLDQAPSGAFHVKVTDLGIAKRVSEMSEDARKSRRSTRVPGTPKYLSPEQIRLKPVDGRADVFSLGIAAFELLAGRAPFKAGDTDGYLKANLEEDPPPVHRVNREVPSFLSPVIAGMMAKDREERYDSDTLARDMELIYQHLISDAPLVEKKNPESVFFVPEVPPAEEGRREKWVMPDWRQFLGWPQIAAMTLVVGVTTAYTLLSWPQMPYAPGRHMPPPPLDVSYGLTPEEALREAQQLLPEGSYWVALSLLEGIPPGSLDPELLHLRWELMEEVQNRLAAPFLEEAAGMLEEGRLDEAETIMKQAGILLPRASVVDAFLEKLRSVETRPDPE